jgi:hypothetical protein
MQKRNEKMGKIPENSIMRRAHIHSYCKEKYLRKNITICAYLCAYLAGPKSHLKR